jgi:hypothetical protein
MVPHSHPLRRLLSSHSTVLKDLISFAAADVDTDADAEKEKRTLELELPSASVVGLAAVLWLLEDIAPGEFKSAIPPIGPDQLNEENLFEALIVADAYDIEAIPKESFYLFEDRDELVHFAVFCAQGWEEMIDESVTQMLRKALPTTPTYAIRYLQLVHPDYLGRLTNIHADYYPLFLELTETLSHSAPMFDNLNTFDMVGFQGMQVNCNSIIYDLPWGDPKNIFLWRTLREKASQALLNEMMMEDCRQGLESVDAVECIIAEVASCEHCRGRLACTFFDILEEEKGVFEAFRSRPYIARSRRNQD